MEQGTHRGRGVATAWPWLCAVMALAAACYPSGVSDVTDLNTVTTLYDQPLANSGGFQKLTTYTLLGSTVANPSSCIIEDLADGGQFQFKNAAIPPAICNTINTELQDLGYTQVNASVSSPASFLVTVAGLNQSYTAWVYYPWYGYWGGYYPGYPWYGWGIYYPWAGYAYSYQIGTIVITMVTPQANSSPDGGVIDAIWTAALNGVNTAPNNTPQVVSAGIVQAFAQSPYLGASPQ